MRKYLSMFMPLLSAVIFLFYPQNSLASDIPSARTIWLKCAGEAISDSANDFIKQALSLGVDSSLVAEYKVLANKKLPPFMVNISVIENSEHCVANIESDYFVFAPLDCEPNGLTYSVRIGCNETDQCEYKMEIDRRELSFSMGLGIKVDGLMEFISATGQCEISDAAI